MPSPSEEHPGLLGALGAARELRGVSVREVPFAELAEQVAFRAQAVGPLTASESAGGTA